MNDNKIELVFDSLKKYNLDDEYKNFDVNRMKLAVKKKDTRIYLNGYIANHNLNLISGDLTLTEFLNTIEYMQSPQFKIDYPDKCI